jgi:hypothetical protein
MGVMASGPWDGGWRSAEAFTAIAVLEGIKSSKALRMWSKNAFVGAKAILCFVKAPSKFGAGAARRLLQVDNEAYPDGSARSLRRYSVASL